MKNAMPAETKEAVVAETPKTKEGTKPASTQVDGAPVEKKARTPKQHPDTKFRLISGVDASTFRGQRGIVVKALQELGPGHHSVSAIVAKSDGIVSKTPIEASVRYHLKGLLEDSKIEALAPETPAPAAVSA